MPSQLVEAVYTLDSWLDQNPWFGLIRQAELEPAIYMLTDYWTAPIPLADSTCQLTRAHKSYAFIGRQRQINRAWINTPALYTAPRSAGSSTAIMINLSAVNLAAYRTLPAKELWARTKIIKKLYAGPGQWAAVNILGLTFACWVDRL